LFAYLSLTPRIDVVNVGSGTASGKIANSA